MKNKYYFSNYENVFCDSFDALQWAYKNGLSKNIIVKTSAPKILLTNKKNIKHIESGWTVDKKRKFQSSIENFSIDIYKELSRDSVLSHEECLCAAFLTLKIQNLIYKASCLEKNDMNNSILFITVNGKGGRAGNFMNSPWEYLLNGNPNFKTLSYDLESEEEKNLNLKGVSKKVRFYIGGWETLLYRIALKVYSFIPARFFNKEAFIANENELIIESAAFLAKKGIRISKVYADNNYNQQYKIPQIKLIIEKCIPLINKRISKWVIPEFINNTENLSISILRDQLELFYKNLNQWNFIFNKSKYKNCILLINMPTTINGIALSKVCRSKNIKVVSMQHGVAKEINAVHLASSVSYEINSSDYHIAFNHNAARASKKSYFSIGETLVSGISNRHLRMAHSSNNLNKSTPAVYVSTNLYTANFGIINSHISDYQQAVNEKNVIKQVLNKLPYKILYKAYPEENKRYPDKNPVLEEAIISNNIKLCDKLVDMRFLIANFRVFITSRATSTLSWLVFSNKPVIFINWQNDNELHQEAYNIFCNGVFVFNSKDQYFYKNLLKFLSKPIKEIELLYEKKRKARSLMIKEYFSEFDKGAGERIANILFNKFLNN